MVNNSNDSKDKRREDRIVLMDSCGLTLKSEGTGEIEIERVLDISGGGVSAVVGRDIPVGTKVVTRLAIDPDGKKSIEGVGEVRRCETVGRPTPQKHYKCGIEIAFPEKGRQLLADFISSTLESGNSIVDRRRGDRPRNGLNLVNPVQFDTTFRLSKESPEVQIRQLSMRNLDDLVAVEIKAWGEEMCATRAMLKSRLEIFPDGMIGAFNGAELLGYVGLMKIKSSSCDKDFSWMGITDGGLIRATHDPDGDCLYGVSLSVARGAPRDVAVKLLKAAGKMSVRSRLKGILFGCRVPNFHKHSKKMSIDEYIRATSSSGRILDPELSLYRQVNCVPIRPIPEYFEDPESLNYGVLVFFENPFYSLQLREFPFFLERISVDFT